MPSAERWPGNAAHSGAVLIRFSQSGRATHEESTMATFPAARTLVTSGLLPGLIWAAFGTAAVAQHSTGHPDFSSNGVGWSGIGGDFLPLPGDGGPKPMTFDPAYPYVP